MYRIIKTGIFAVDRIVFSLQKYIYITVMSAYLVFYDAVSITDVLYS
jgi:hypothetical protein